MKKKQSGGVGEWRSGGVATRARGLDVNGVNSCKCTPLRPRGRTGARTKERLLCTWREAVKAADYVLEHFGNRSRDRGIWVWYCRRIGLDTFLDIADEVISSTRQGELRWPTRAFHRHLQEALPKNPLTQTLQRGNPLPQTLQRGRGGVA